MKPEIIIFGTGGWFINNYSWLQSKYKIVAFLDNNSSRHYQSFCGVDILPPVDVKQLKYDFILIASMYVEEIRNQLLELNVLENKIISKDDLPARNEQLEYIFSTNGPCERLREALSERKLGKNKKILFCASGLNNSGVEKALAITLANINRINYTIDLLLLGKERCNFFDKIPDDINVFYLFQSEQEIIDGLDAIKLNSASRLFSAIVPDDYDLLIAYNEGFPTKIISGCTSSISRCISWVHLDLYHWHSSSFAYLSQEEEQKAYQNYDEIIFVSSGVQSGFHQRFGCVAERQEHIIHNPFPPPQFLYTASQSSCVLPFFSYVSVGRLHKQKGLDSLIRAHAELRAEGLPLHLILLGGGEERSNLEQLCTELRVEDSVSILGFVANPYPWIRAANLYVSSAVAEGYPMVIGEALLLGTPVLASNCSGNNDILSAGLFGELYSNQPGALVVALRRLVQEPERLQQLKDKAALAVISPQFDAQAIAHSIDNIVRHWLD
nr:glycosyltransferase [uncultured Tolumonas sp.]